MTTSTAYAELGGLTPPRPSTRPGVLPHEPTPAANTGSKRVADRDTLRDCRHLFDPLSGWCGCGLRDDGQLAEGSPAWRAAIDRTMPIGEETP